MMNTNTHKATVFAVDPLIRKHACSGPGIAAGMGEPKRCSDTVGLIVVDVVLLHVVLLRMVMLMMSAWPGYA